MSQYESYTASDFASEDIFDSRDVEEAIKDAEILADDPDYPEESDRYNDLLTMRDEIRGGEWEYGQQFIRDSYFEDYARQFAEDIGAIDDDARWPATCIDWEQAASELRMDFSPVDVAGVTFWTR